MVPPETVNAFAAVMTVVVQVGVLFLFAGLVLERRGSVPAYIAAVRRHAIRIAFGISLAAALGSLLYSEVVGYAPCVLCWWQRVFMYPQVLIAGIALWRNDRGALRYLLALSLIGAAIAGYHYLLEWGLIPSGLCPATGSGPSCAQRFVYEFGYISIPLMSFTAFAISALTAYVGRERRVAEHEGTR
jgi:disulfide bond formation protein DsbB